MRACSTRFAQHVAKLTSVDICVIIILSVLVICVFALYLLVILKENATRFGSDPDSWFGSCCSRLPVWVPGFLVWVPGLVHELAEE